MKKIAPRIKIAPKIQKRPKTSKKVQKCSNSFKTLENVQKCSKCFPAATEPQDLCRSRRHSRGGRRCGCRAAAAAGAIFFKALLNASEPANSARGGHHVTAPRAKMSSKCLIKLQINVMSTPITCGLGHLLLSPKVFRKHFQFVRPSPPRRGPSGRRGSGRRLEGPCRGGDGRKD